VITDEGKGPSSLDQIAASKRRSGWDRIFEILKRDGLIDAKNLRELPSDHYEREIVRKARVQLIRLEQLSSQRVLAVR